MSHAIITRNVNYKQTALNENPPNVVSSNHLEITVHPKLRTRSLSSRPRLDGKLHEVCKSTKYFGSFKAKQRCSVLLHNWSSWRLVASCWSHFIGFSSKQGTVSDLTLYQRLKILLLLFLLCVWLRPWLPRSYNMLHSYSVIYVAYMSALPSPDALLMLKHAAYITLNHTDSYSSYLLGVDGHV